MMKSLRRTSGALFLVSLVAACGGTPWSAAGGGEEGAAGGAAPGEVGAVGGVAGGGRDKGGGLTTTPTIVRTWPHDGAAGVSTQASVIVIFSEPMDPATLTTRFALTSLSATAVPGTVGYDRSVLVFRPSAPLAGSSRYTATIAAGARSALGVTLAANQTFSFTTCITSAPGAAVGLGVAGDYVMLAKTGISVAPTSVITGHVGVSPAAASSITGLSLSMDATHAFSTSPQVTGNVYAADYAAPTPATLAVAIEEMQIAFADAAARTASIAGLGDGDVGGMVLTPGIYAWSTSLRIPRDVTLKGSATDVWIFQLAQGLTLSNGASVNLTGGALARNVFWQVTGPVELGPAAHGEGIVLGQTSITLRAGASIRGRLLAQAAIALEDGTVVAP